MKISNILQISNIYKNNSTVKDKVNIDNAKKDDLNISSKALDYQNVVSAINKVPDIREEKVNDIIDKINNGNYNISNEEVANKMLLD